MMVWSLPAVPRIANSCGSEPSGSDVVYFGTDPLTASSPPSLLLVESEQPGSGLSMRPDRPGNGAAPATCFRSIRTGVARVSLVPSRRAG